MAYGLYAFVTLVALVNPVEAAATFASLTTDFTSIEQRRIALRSVLIAGGILLVFGFVGEELLRALGIGFPAFRIAGGLLLLKVAFDMVFAKAAGQERLTTDERREATQTDDPTVFPLAIPIITGPGALTTIVTLMATTHDDAFRVGALVAVVVVVFAITYIAMRGAQWLQGILGATGVNAISRIMGILIAAISVQLIIIGVKALL